MRCQTPNKPSTHSMQIPKFHEQERQAHHRYCALAFILAILRSRLRFAASGPLSVSKT